MWRSSNNPNDIIANTQNNLFCTSVSDAIRPIDHATLVAVEIDNYGSVAFAASSESAKPTNTTTIADCKFIKQLLV
jgi:hypothetical protein